MDNYQFVQFVVALHLINIDMNSLNTQDAAPLRVGNLRSTHGVKIHTQYNPMFSETNRQRLYKVSGVNFVVEGWDGVAIDKDSDVLLVLINRYFRRHDLVQEQVYHVHMRYSQTYQLQTSFIGGIPGEIVNQTEDKLTGETIVCRPQLALCIGDVWQIDPIQPNDEHNFNFAWKLPSS
jgi:hypothetical protein